MISFLYLVFGSGIIVFELMRKKKFWFDYLSLFNLYFIMYYIFPAIMINGELFGYINRHSRLFSGSNDMISFRTGLTILLSYIFVLIGYFVVPNITVRKRNQSLNKPSFDQSKLGKSIEIVNEELFFQRSIWILVCVGFVSMLLYSSLFGGVGVLLTNPNSIRDGSLLSANAPLEFVRRFIPSLMYASYIVYGFYLTSKKKKYLFLTLALSFFWLIINGGRGAMIQYLLILVLAYMLKNRKKVKLMQITIISGLIFLLVLYLRPFFMSLEQLENGLGAFWDSMQNILSSGRYNMDSLQDRVFSFTDSIGYKYISTEAAISSVNSGVHNMNFFFEVLIALFSVIPSVILPFNVSQSIVFYNTIYIIGSYDSPIPPGGVALGYYSLSILGVILFSLVVGNLGKRMNGFFLRLKSVHSHILYVVCMFLWLSLFFNGELRHTLQRDFVLIIFLIILLFKTRRRKI